MENEWLVYILQSDTSPNRTYVGVTNNMTRRLRQHNGEICGGAKCTHSSRPWKVVARIYGFDGKVSAMQFEWSMHHPRIRKLTPPHQRVEGRINCASQLVADKWCECRIETE